MRTPASQRANTKSSAGMVSMLAFSPVPAAGVVTEAASSRVE
jgi:hypothetical protein